MYSIALKKMNRFYLLAFISLILFCNSCAPNLTNYNYNRISYEKIIPLSTPLEIDERFALAELFLLQNAYSEKLYYTNEKFGVIIGIGEFYYVPAGEQTMYTLSASGEVKFKVEIYLKNQKIKIRLTNFKHSMFKEIYSAPIPPKKFISPREANEFYWTDLKKFIDNEVSLYFTELEKSLNDRIETKKEW